MSQRPDNELRALLAQLLQAARKPGLALPEISEVSRLPRADQPRLPSRQYATLAELERACGDDPGTVEEWLASRHPTVIGRDDTSGRWRSPLDGAIPPPPAG
ncbi:hypothetical protein [Actinoplanes sp. G11-F43]|uniref:hypothetical protein n=1 Tax=Actinoplanes sp. G11-F43 TaxID=3424130 RepID=UPI003D340252